MGLIPACLKKGNGIVTKDPGVMPETNLGGRRFKNILGKVPPHDVQVAAYASKKNRFKLHELVIANIWNQHGEQQMAFGIIDKCFSGRKYRLRTIESGGCYLGFVGYEHKLKSQFIFRIPNNLTDICFTLEEELTHKGHDTTSQYALMPQ